MSRLLGRKASPCRKCSGLNHYVNRMGGAECATCSPPRTAADLASKLTIEGGVWIDPANRFDMVEPQSPVAAGHPAATSPRTVGQSSQPHGQQHPAAELTGRNVNGFKTHWLSRGPGGEFSEAELSLYGSPVVWGTPGESVTLVELRLKRVGPGLTPERNAGGGAKVSKIVGRQKSANGSAEKLPFCST